MLNNSAKKFLAVVEVLVFCPIVLSSRESCVRVCEIIIMRFTVKENIMTKPLHIRTGLAWKPRLMHYYFGRRPVSSVTYIYWDAHDVDCAKMKNDVHIRVSV